MRIRIIDAFTDTAFAGNPAAVLLLPAGPWPSDRWLQQVATEMNLSETAFAKPLNEELLNEEPLGEEPPNEDPDAWALRWLTPALEVDLCGHATLATVHLLHTTGALHGSSVRFESRSGTLRAEVAADGSITLDFPANPPQEVPVPEGLAEILGAPIGAAHDTGALGDLLVELADERTVRTLRPDQTRLRALTGLRGVIVTAAPDGAAADYDFVSRWFGAGVDVGEDPVTGSAHTALAPLWAARLDRTELTGRQVSARGGSVHTRLDGDRVLLTGRAVTVLDGELTSAAS